MAKIVLGAGSSHTPMLLAADETLPRFEETDQKIKHRDKEGRPTTYAELLEKADPKMAEMVAPTALVARQNKVRAAMARLSKTLNTTGLDALIVMSDDQDEAYLEDARPTFAIYYGDTILNSNEQHEQYHQRFPEWYVKNRQGLQEFGVLVGAGLEDGAVEILVDQKVAQASGSDDADARVARIGLDRLADGLAELVAAPRPRLVRREICVEEYRHDGNRFLLVQQPAMHIGHAVAFALAFAHPLRRRRIETVLHQPIDHVQRQFGVDRIGARLVLFEKALPVLDVPFRKTLMVLLVLLTALSGVRGARPEIMFFQDAQAAFNNELTWWGNYADKN